MLNGFVNVSITKDITEDIKKSLLELASKTVCVGVPQEENVSREVASKGKRKEIGTITNAELLYIHTHGVRDVEMRKVMQQDLDKGTPYSKAHEMFVHENGSPLWQVPPRPILEPALDNSKDEIAEEMKKSVLTALEGGNIGPTIEAVGMLGQNVARDWFTNPQNKWHKNSPSTVRRKGSDNPLIDTGELRKAITYTVKEK